MAYSYDSDADDNNPVWKTSVKSGGDYCWKRYGGWLYKGYMFVEGGTPYTFGSCVDDSVLLIIDGEDQSIAKRRNKRRTNK